MALGYRELASEIQEKNIVLYGINDKGAEAAQAWVESEDLPFLVLQDPGRAVGTAYRMSDPSADKYVANASGGRRPAVVIDEKGYILAWEPDMNTVDQIRELLALI